VYPIRTLRTEITGMKPLERRRGKTPPAPDTVIIAILILPAVLYGSLASFAIYITLPMILFPILILKRIAGLCGRNYPSMKSP
jgi:hypothetical protein